MEKSNLVWGSTGVKQAQAFLTVMERIDFLSPVDTIYFYFSMVRWAMFLLKMSQCTVLRCVKIPVMVCIWWILWMLVIKAKCFGAGTLMWPPNFFEDHLIECAFLLHRELYCQKLEVFVGSALNACINWWVTWAEPCTELGCVCQFSTLWYSKTWMCLGTQGHCTKSISNIIP